MSVFFKNDCNFGGCIKSFASLADLIVHIEQEHLDLDADSLQLLANEKPECVPMSYVLRFGQPQDPVPRYWKRDVSTNAVIEEGSEMSPVNDMVRIFNRQYSVCDYQEKKRTPPPPPPLRFNDMRLMEDFSPELLGHMKHKLFTLDNTQKKPFGCNMPGCQKRYKNVNGIKCHYKKSHNFKHTRPAKKSLLKRRVTKVKSTRPEEEELCDVPALSAKAQVSSTVSSDVVYYNVPKIVNCEEAEYLRNFNTLMPTSTGKHVSNQVPLPNLSFNYCTFNDIDLEEFQGKNANNFAMTTRSKH